jgi:hypothetical protein
MRIMAAHFSLWWSQVRAIVADFSKGVLTLTLPKSADAPRSEKKIEVRTGQRRSASRPLCSIPSPRRRRA